MDIYTKSTEIFTKNIEFFTKNYLNFYQISFFTKDIEKNTKFNLEKIPNILKILPTINYFFLPIIFIFLPKNTEFFYQTQK